MQLAANTGRTFATKARIDNRKKNLSNSNISPMCPHNMANFGPLAAEIGSVVWGTPANFNGFRILASLLQQRRSMEANQTLHDVRPSPGLVHYVYTFGGSCDVMEFWHVQNSLCVQVLHSPIFMAAVWNRAGNHIFALWFLSFLSFFFFFFSVPNLSGRWLDD